jgi:glycolate oxidase iron-sulfur subunit
MITRPLEKSPSTRPRAASATLDPTWLLSSNIGCRLHLGAGIDVQGLPWPTRHPLTVLAQPLEQPSSNQESP